MAKVKDASAPYRTPQERVDDDAAVLAAMGEAVRETLLLHKKLGYPVATWRNGRVEWIEPQDIEV